MTIFEHVSVFVSIVLGLAVVHLLGGLSLILDARVRTKVYWIHLAWTAGLLLLTVLVWLGSFALAPVREFGAAHVFNLVAYAMVIYLMSGLLFPVRGEEVTDFREHFHANRTRFFSLGVLFVATDAIDGLLEWRAAGLPLDVGQFGTLAVWLVVFVIGIRSSSDRFHAFAVLAFLVGLGGFLVSLIDTGILSG
ncbi:MAG: hypothetical protein R3195_10840 [Gemmatimonadota bacterium]|nr:hypothetical protein [Gemmatimonadota bacterium]